MSCTRIQQLVGRDVGLGRVSSERSGGGREGGGDGMFVGEVEGRGEEWGGCEGEGSLDGG